MFIWMMFVLKIPIVMLLALVYWAIKNSDQQEEHVDPGGGRGHGYSHPRRPRPPRRGPHAEPPPRAPSRVRAHAGALSRPQPLR